ncbi:ankyrin [Rhizoclosmatium globosum]|uniref:Ankyrin n=1 Tax=Rhizoclosmatium globosum TaxID=329046 RepID=A0A1Y2BRN0_9FUNG|nr:ankyrin [Rhizoclosmatium globosum]|eukprot:ORY37383.1 ankyrin [Rhizoclosmatium globosum]
MPFTGTGKIARTELAARDVFGVGDDEDDEDGEDGGEDEEVKAWGKLVGRVWREVLGVSEGVRVGRGTRFGELGGDSLKALKVCRVLDEELRSAGAVAASGVEAGNEEEEDKEEKEKGGKGGNNGFGQLLGVLAPAELLKRPKLREFAKYLSESYAGFLPSPENVTTAAEPSKQPTKSTTSKPKSQATSTPAIKSIDAVTNLLYSAVAANLPEVTLHLIKSMNAQPNPPSPTRTTTPLHIACINSHEAVARVLLENGALSNALDSTGATPFHLSCHNGPLSLVKLFLSGTTMDSPKPGSSSKRKPDKNAKSSTPPVILFQTDDNSQTPLHHAARSGAPNSVVEYLIDAVGVASEARLLDAKDVWGRTALHWASVNGHGGVVKVLVARGVDVKVKDLEGEDALEIAERRARCGAAERGAGLRPSVFADIAKILGGSGGTKSVARFK